MNTVGNLNGVQCLDNVFSSQQFSQTFLKFCPPKVALHFLKTSVHILFYFNFLIKGIFRTILFLTLL